MEQNKLLENLFQRVWVYFVTTFALAALGYIILLFKELIPKSDFGRLSLAQCLLLAANCIFFFFVKSPELLQAEEAAEDTSASPPLKAYEKLGYTAATWDAAKLNAIASLWQFRNAWLCTLGSWALLYAALFFLYNHQTPTRRTGGGQPHDPYRARRRAQTAHVRFSLPFFHQRPAAFLFRTQAGHRPKGRRRMDELQEHDAGQRCRTVLSGRAAFSEGGVPGAKPDLLRRARRLRGRR